MGIDECTKRFEGSAWATRRLPLAPERDGINMPFTIAHYNQSYGGIDRHDALLVPEQRVLPEDVLR